MKYIWHHSNFYYNLLLQRASVNDCFCGSLKVRSTSDLALREKSPNTELFLVGIFPHSDWIQRDTKYLSVFSPNAGKYGPEITPYLDTSHAGVVAKLQHFILISCPFRGKLGRSVPRKSYYWNLLLCRSI